MKIITVASRKGGAAKTTITGHLAVAAIEADVGKVAILDLDDQAGLSMWWNDRPEGRATIILVDHRAYGGVAGAVAACREAGIDLLLIDTAPRVSQLEAEAVQAADLVVIPVQPSIHDLRGVSATVRMIEPHSRPFMFVMSRVKPGTKIAAEARAALKGWGGLLHDGALGDRVDFRTSMTDGLTVLETDGRGRSAEEVRELWRFTSRKMDRTNVIS